jgi:hypothetical protein
LLLLFHNLQLNQHLKRFQRCLLKMELVFLKVVLARPPRVNLKAAPLAQTMEHGRWALVVLLVYPLALR